MQYLHRVLVPASVFGLALVSVLLTSCNIESTVVVDQAERIKLRSVFVINGDNEVTVGWAVFDHAPHPAPSEHDYGPGELHAVEIHRGHDAEFTASASTLIATVALPADRYIDTTVVNGEIYYYRAVPIGLLANGLTKEGEPTLPTPGQPYSYASIEHLGYSEHIGRIFASSCAVGGCHVGSAPAHDDHATLFHDEGPQFSLGTWEDVMSGGTHGSVVVPFRPKKSHLLFHVNSDTNFAPVSTPHMPLPAFQLPDDQIQALYDWIEAGAPSDKGSIAFTTYPAGRVLVTNQAEDLMTVIDRGTNLVARYVQAGVPDVFAQPPEAPHNVTVDAANGFVYVNLVGGGKVLKYNLEDLSLVGQIAGLISPTQVALSPTGDTAYVAQFAAGNNAIRILRASTMTNLGQISANFLDKPHGVQVTPDGTELWVTGNLSDNILVVDLADFSTRLIQLNDQPPGTGGELLPYQTVMTRDNMRVYVTNQAGNSVQVIDRRTHEVMKTIPVGQNPLIPAISPDDRWILVPNRNTNDLSVIDTQVDSVVRTIANIGPQPHGVAITPDGQYAYVSCENVLSSVPPHHPTEGSKDPGFVTIIDMGILQAVKQFEVGAFGAGVAIVE